MKPYFETDLGVLYHGDCLEIMPQIEPVDLVLTDPPYGVSMLRGDSKIKERIHGDDKIPDVGWMANHEAIVWGGNQFCHQLPISSGWFVWFKYAPEMSRHSQAEIAWTNTCKTVRHYAQQYTGFMRAIDGHFHPTQKPVKLFVWCLNRSKTNGLVLDPYLGSGTTAVACEQLNRRWIGIEISEKYCEIAAKRIERERQQLKLFQPEASKPKPEQKSLFKVKP
jgi:site-specific DNA-methyltransferase (adenine-specific)